MDKLTLEKSKKFHVTTSSPFTQGPIYGTLDGGEDVVITHVGDAEEMSPCYLVIDKSGRSAWVSQELVTVTDPRLTPRSIDESLRQSSSSSRSPSAAGMSSSR